MIKTNDNNVRPFVRPAENPQPDYTSEDWRDHPAVVVSYLATAILIGWTEGKHLTLVDCHEAMPEIKDFLGDNDWNNALTAAKLIAQTSGLKIPRSTS